MLKRPSGLSLFQASAYQAFTNPSVESISKQRCYIPVSPAPAAPKIEAMIATPDVPVNIAAELLPSTATAPAPISGAAKPADRATKR